MNNQSQQNRCKDGCEENGYEYMFLYSKNILLCNDDIMKFYGSLNLTLYYLKVDCLNPFSLFHLALICVLANEEQESRITRKLYKINLYIFYMIFFLLLYSFFTLISIESTFIVC